MNREQLREEIKFNLTGGILECDLDDVSLDKLINACLREMQRYVDTVKFVTVPFQRSIDTSKLKVNSVVKVYRVAGYAGEVGDTTSQSDTSSISINVSNSVSMSDPMYASMWQMMGGTATLYNLQSSVYDLTAYNQLMQMRNTTSVDLAFIYDKSAEKLYINVSSGVPSRITIAYVPRYDDVEEVVSDFWIDILTRLCIAQAKIILGRIRTRYVQSGALWEQDGATILEEGKAELEDLRTRLSAATLLTYAVD